jgi:hypothetical protein
MGLGDTTGIIALAQNMKKEKEERKNEPAE